MKIEYNGTLINSINSIRIIIGASGIADIDSSWDRAERIEPFSRIYITLDGEGEVISRGVTYKLRRGEVFFIPCGAPIGFKCTGPMRQMFFHVNYIGSDGLDVFRNCDKAGSLSDIRSPDKLTEAAFKSTKLSDAALFLNLTTEVLAAALDDAGEHIGKVFSPLINKILSNVSGRADIQLSLKDYADAAFVEESSLSRRFKSEVGINFSKYVDAVVLNRAACELLNSTRSIKEISAAYGFCDEFYFSRRFKQTFGETPSAYRKNHRV